MKLNKKPKKGFTIVELVVVIAVIGILSAILIPTFMGLTEKANKAALQSDLTAIYTAYAVEAADGVITDNSGTEPEEKAIAVLTQKEVAIEYKSNVYFYNDKNEWEADETRDIIDKGTSDTEDDAPYVVVGEKELSTFSGGVVYNIK